jgi:hypothetical protein
MADSTNFCTTAFVINDMRVYDALHIRAKAPDYFKVCSTTILDILKKMMIPDTEYIFASCSRTGVYKECTNTYKNRRILFKADWAEQNVPGFYIVTAKSPAPPSTTAPTKPVPRHVPVASPMPPVPPDKLATKAPAPLVPAPSAASTTKPAKTYPPAPPLLNLEDSEKFVDADGKIYNIEVRGERHYDKIWFRAKDVESMLNLENIRSILGQDSYEEGQHYRTFGVQIVYTIGADQKQNKIEVRIFLSYWGLVKMLFGRRHNIAIQFQRWAIEKLFAVQLGTLEAKRDLAAGVLGVTPKTLKAVLDTNATELPVIYMFELGTVKDLRNSFPTEIPAAFNDTDVVFKYGLTTNFKQRTGQHETSFKKFSYGNGKPVNILLKYHIYVDPLHLGQAEMDIEKYFKQVSKWHLLFKEEKVTEVIAVPKDVVETILQVEFQKLGLAYAGKYKDLQVRVENETALRKQARLQVEMQVAMQQKMEAQYSTLLQEKDKVAEESKIHIQEMKQTYQELLKEKDLRMKEKDELLSIYRELAKNSKVR